MSVFEIGDRVRIVSQGSEYRSQVGTVTGIQHTSGVPGAALEVLREYIVELDSGQLEFFVGTDLELK